MKAHRDGDGHDPKDLTAAVPAEGDEARLHARAVDAWIASSGARKLEPSARIALFQAALEAVWARARVTLGAVTLGAIGERVAHAASRREPLLVAVAVDESGFDLAALAEAVKGVPDAEALAAMAALLRELLTVLGRLTAEILTPALHTELARVRAAGPSETERR